MEHEKDAGMNLALYLEMKCMPFSIWHLLYLNKNHRANYIKSYY